MINFYKEKIIGKWENDFISYVFDEQGKISIHWIKENLSDTGNWTIENDEITIIYGNNFYQIWKGKINHITDNELSITDLSNQIGTVDILYRKELFPLETLKVIIPTPEKKNFKEKLTETVWGVISIAFLAAFLGGIFYVIYKYGFKYQSHEYNYFFIGLMLFVASAIPIIFIFYKGSDHDTLFLKGYFIFYASIIIVPILYYLLVIFFAIISLWYYLLVIGVIIALIVLSLNKEVRWIHKSIIILMSIVSLYFLYDAKSILKIKFEVYFDNKIVGTSSEEDE
jgi:hypothetical protein